MRPSRDSAYPTPRFALVKSKRVQRLIPVLVAIDMIMTNAFSREPSLRENHIASGGGISRVTVPSVVRQSTDFFSPLINLHGKR